MLKTCLLPPWVAWCGLVEDAVASAHPIRGNRSVEGDGEAGSGDAGRDDASANQCCQSGVTSRAQPRAQRVVGIKEDLGVGGNGGGVHGQGGTGRPGRNQDASSRSRSAHGGRGRA